MNRTPLVFPLSVVIAACMLSACGGGGGINTVSTTPTPAPPPIPSGPFTPTGPILAAVQTTSIASPAATGTTPNFSSLASATSFPLLETTVDGTFGGNATNTNAGAFLTFQTSGSSTLTVNGPSSSINNVATVPYPGTKSSNYPNVSTDLQGGNLDYTRFGDWLLSDNVEGLYLISAFTGGFVTPTSAIPATGIATYNGSATGVYNDQAPCNCGGGFVSTFKGDVSLTANFAQSNINGSITGITLTSLSNFTPGPMNDIAFSATIDRSANLFSGTTSVSTTPGGSWAFSNAAGGRIDGRFYGPTAQEIGAVFQLTEGVKRLIGSFGAKGH